MDDATLGDQLAHDAGTLGDLTHPPADALIERVLLAGTRLRELAARVEELEVHRQRLYALVTLHDQECPNCPVLLRWRREDQAALQRESDGSSDGE